jgi:hypothetical protein
MPKPRNYPIETVAIARALHAKNFSRPAIGRILRLKPTVVRHLTDYDPKNDAPSAEQEFLADYVATSLEAARLAGHRAIATALREAADAIERGSLPIPDKDL